MTKLEDEFLDELPDGSLSNPDFQMVRKAFYKVAKKYIEKALDDGEDIGMSCLSIIYNEYDKERAEEEKTKWLKENGVIE